MTDFDYAEIPACATIIQPEGSDRSSFSHDKKKTIILSAPVNSTNEVHTSTNYTHVSAPSSPLVSATSPSSSAKFTNALLSSTLFLPTLPDTSNVPGNDQEKLLSNREPLSLPTTAVNFRRFVSRSGPIFWLQDRVEEIVMWKKGWKTTCAWMALYGLLCYFPRLFLLLPNIIIIAILLSTYNPAQSPEPSAKKTNVLPKEGSAEWFANLQAIQNLMGIVSTAHDMAISWLPIMTWNSPYTTHVFTLICLSTLFLLPVVVYIPITPVLLALGILPLVCTHPQISPLILLVFPPFLSKRKYVLQRMIDNDNLSEEQWYAEKREVELMETERWTANTGWSKFNLKDGEKPWSSSYIKDSDGGEDINELVFNLPSRWDFIPSETWRLDYNGTFASCGTDENGWVYYDDAWQNASNTSSEDWKLKGMTRRRRWTHRIYLVSA